jgi:hypothetical protein
VKLAIHLTGGITLSNRLFSRSVVRGAANAATVGFILTAILQLLLALGLLPISMAWGGTQSELTPAFRISGFVAAVVLCLFAYLVRRRVGLAGPESPSRLTKILAWLVTIYLGLNVVGNFVSASRAETLIFGPLSLLLFIACLLVAVSKTP